MTELDAERYDRWFDAPWGHYAANVERRALAAALGPDPGRVLDVGCGTGRLTVPTGHRFVVSCDRSAAMLAIAHDRVAGHLVRADADHLPFADGSFDVTTAVTLCEFTANATHTIAELARVTLAGGRVVVGALNRRSPWGLAHRRKFDAAPWSSARFLTDAELRRIGSVHGAVRTSVVLYAPGAGRGIRWWGPALEAIGRFSAPRSGAFIVATIDLPVGSGQS